MKAENSLPEGNKITEENKMILYGFLIDQLTRYNTIIWQIPTALFAANILVIDKMINRPYILLTIVLFNSSFIYAFYKMIVQQRAIIETVRNAEASLRVDYNDFIPNFAISRIRATWLFVWTLGLLNSLLCLYALVLILNFNS
jgi:hypothetical protein